MKRQFASECFKGLSDIYETIVGAHNYLQIYLENMDFVCNAVFGWCFRLENIEKLLEEASASHEVNLADIKWRGIESVMKKYAPDLLPLLGIVFEAWLDRKIETTRKGLILPFGYDRKASCSIEKSCEIFRHLALTLFDIYCDYIVIGLTDCMSLSKTHLTEGNGRVWKLSRAKNIAYSLTTLERSDYILCGGHAYMVLRGANAKYLSNKPISYEDRANTITAVFSMLQGYFSGDREEMLL